MEIEDIQRSFRALTEASVASTTEKLSDRRQAARWASPEALSARQRELELARYEYQLGRYFRSEELLQRLLSNLEPAVLRCEEKSGLSLAQLAVVYASAKTLLGQVRDELGLPDKAQKAFGEAARRFSRWLHKATPTAQNYIDYGVALYVAGHEEAAKAEFDKAISAGGASAEAYRYLGMRYREKGDHGKAEEFLIRAVELAPEDFLALRALAETIEAQGQRDDEAVRAYQEAALAMARDERLDEALTVLDQALSLNPNDSVSLSLRAELLLIMGQYDEALRDLDLALELSPDEPLYLGSKERILRLKGEYEGALRVQKRMLELNPNDASALKYKGETLRLLGQYGNALEALNRALELKPDDAWTLGTKAQVLLAQDQNDKQAVELLRRAVVLGPDLAWTHAELGTALLLRGDYKEALGALDRALELSPDDPVYLENKGRVLCTLGHYEEALWVLDRALELNPEVASALKYKGEALRLLGRYDEALRTLNRALKSNPGDAWALSTKAQILRDQNDDEEVSRTLLDLDWALGSDSDDTSALEYKEGEALRLKGDHDGALRALNRALELNPGDAWALGTKAQVLRDQNDNEGAVKLLERAAQLAPGLAWVHADLGEALLMLGDYEEALRALDQALELEPGNVSALSNKGDLLRVLGYYEEALKVLDQALEMDGGKVWLLSSKGAALSALERPEEALEALDETLKLLPNETWTLAVKGGTLCNIAAYEDALHILERVIELDPSIALAHGFSGWAFENLKAKEKALQAYGKATDLEPENLWWRRGYADALYMLPDRKEVARGLHEEILEEAKSYSEEADADTLTLLGWSYCRLQQWDEAVRAFGKALSLKADLAYAQLDLALVVMCSGRYALGLENYQQGVELAKGKGALTGRGLLHVARRELEEATDLYPELKKASDVQRVRELLDDAYEEADKEASPKLRSILARNPLYLG